MGSIQPKYNIYSLYDLMILNNVVLSCPIILDDGENTDHFITSNGDVYKIKNGTIKYRKLKQDKHGYCRVNIRIHTKENEKESVTLSVHRLVAMAFIPRIAGKNEVNHKDGNKSNNTVDNLEWVDRSDNMLHAYANDLNHKGIDNSQSVYTEEQIHEVCRLLSENNLSRAEINKVTGVSLSIIKGILDHKKWKHISKFYNIDGYNKVSVNTGSTPKATEEQIHEVCRLLQLGNYTANQIFHLTGVSEYTIHDIKGHKTWIRISKQYNF